MSEFETSRSERPPEMQLIARMKLQRVVFGAFAVVLVALFALGLSAYRDMQANVRNAENALEQARQDRGMAEARLRNEGEEHARSRAMLKDAHRKLARAKAVLALHEIRAGRTGRARELIDESRRLGPPAWLPLVESSLESPGLSGDPAQALPPGWTAAAHAHGFIATDAEGRRHAWIGEWASLPEGAWPALTGRGVAYSNERLHLPGGAMDVQGRAVGGFADGSVLVNVGPGLLRRIGAEMDEELALPLKLEPQSVCVAAAAPVVAMRLGDAVYAGGLNDGLHLYGGRGEDAPDLIALDASGEVLGVARGAAIVVTALTGGERTVKTAAPPQEIALLFGGGVLVTIENGELAYYEVETGIELTRAGSKVQSTAATRDGLQIATADNLRKLTFTEPK